MNIKTLFYFIMCISFIAPIDESTLARTDQSSASSTRHRNRYTDTVLRLPGIELQETPELTPKEQAIEDTKGFPDRHITIEDIWKLIPELTLLQPDINLGYMRYQDFAIIAYKYIDNMWVESDFGRTDPAKMKLADKYYNKLKQNRMQIIAEIADTDKSIYFRAMSGDRQYDTIEKIEEMVQEDKERRKASREHEADLERRKAERKERIRQMEKRIPFPSMKDMTELTCAFGAVFGVCKDPKDVAEEARTGITSDSKQAKSDTGINPDPRQAASSSRNHLT